MLVQDCIEDDSCQAADGDAAVEDDAPDAGEVLEQLRYSYRQHTHGDAHADDEEVVVVRSIKADFAERLDAVGSDHAEHGDTGTAEDGHRNAGNERSHLGEQTQHDQDDAGTGDDEAALDIGE